MYKVRLTGLPGFSTMDQYPLEQLFFEDKTAFTLYENFKHTINEKIEEKKFFPVMRMCDGEYIYCVGKKKPEEYNGWQTLKFYASKLSGKQVTSWGEAYTKDENRILKSQFPGLLQEIAKHGFIANHFVYSHTHFCEEYIKPLQQWYLKNNIPFDASNYTSFYFVYVLLNGPDSKALFSNRNILVLSSFNKKKCAAVEAELKRRGAASAYFVPISPTKSMLDKINTEKYSGRIDLALIAGGIGSANILLQCKPLNTVCIDAGFCLECIADASRRTERIFCMPDAEF